jgi:ABC-2 type transport system ATP-binding protein
LGAAIEIRDVSKRFRLYKEKYTSLKERVMHAGRTPYTDFWALRDIDFEIQAGETVGILGRNGCGKSTLLKCVAGILQPTEGDIRLRGHLAAMLELGAGFQPELSGRDNIFLNASLLGLARREVERRFDDIVAFAELEDFIDNQVRFYSSGMYVRLGFAVAVNVDPDILLVDEVLAVGDERFQQKCMERVHELQRSGCTIVVVSHAADMMRQICDKVVVMDAGRVIAMAAPGEAIRAFRDRLIEIGADAPLPQVEDTGVVPVVAAAAVPVPIERRVTITGCRAERPDGTDRPHFFPDDRLTIVLDLQVRSRIPNVAFGCTIWSENGNLIYDCDSAMQDDFHDLESGRATVRYDFGRIGLLDGRYTVNVRVQDAGAGVVHARQEPAVTIEVVNPGRATGVVAMSFAVQVEAPGSGAIGA